MGYDKVVDSAALDGALTGIANAIRGKTGGTAALTLEQMPGAISGIETEPVLEELAVTENGEYTPGEGVDGFGRVTVEVPAAVPERTAWYRPPDWPDITSLPLTDDVDGYFTADKNHPASTGEISVFVVGNGKSRVDLGDVIDGVFIPVEENHNLVSTTVTLDLSKAKTDYPVILVKCDNAYKNTAFNDNAPIIEVCAKRVASGGWMNFKTCRVITLGASGQSFASGGLSPRGYPSANLRYLDLSKYTGYGNNSRDLYSIFNGFKALTVLRWPTVPKNSVLLLEANQSNWPDSAFNGCESLLELDMSIFDTSEVTRLTSVFSGCTSLRTLDLSGWNLGACTGMSNTFKGCAALVNLITDGATMPSVSFSLSDSTLLSVDSLVGVINALPVLAEGTAATLTLGTTNTAKLTAEQISVATEKGWSVA